MTYSAEKNAIVADIFSHLTNEALQNKIKIQLSCSPPLLLISWENFCDDISSGKYLLCAGMREWVK